MPHREGLAEELAEFEAEARGRLNINLTRRQLQAFEAYESLLIEWNSRFNLTAITNPKDIAIKHFLDSLTCILAMGSPTTGRVTDVGAGAGFPGIPIKIASSQVRLTPVESPRQKTAVR